MKNKCFLLHSGRLRRAFAMVAAAAVMTACTTTGSLPEGEVLYTGLKGIVYTDSVKYANFNDVATEVDAALACEPNGALLGSSSLKNPLQTGLRIWNRYVNDTTAFGRWMFDHFASEPVLLSNVNPEMRAQVAENVLKANGYFKARVEHASVISARNKKKGKIEYRVTMGPLATIDTLKYLGFKGGVDSLIRAHAGESLIHAGDPFSVSKLDAERTRLSTLLRNNGYYYYRPAYATYIADSVSVPGKVEVHLQPVSDIPADALRQWYLGKLRIELKRNMQEQITDSAVYRVLSVHYAGSKPPIRPRAFLRDIKLRPRRLYSLTDANESASVLNSLGLFSVANFTFSPRRSAVSGDSILSAPGDSLSATSGYSRRVARDTLDMKLSCTLDKPYDVSIEANYAIKSNDRTGPGLVLGFTKRNAFRGGEKLNVNLKGSYEWQTGRNVKGQNSRINSYEYGADMSIEYPRLETPFGLFKRHRFYTPPSTLFSISGDVLNRAEYFKMITLTGAVTYKFQATAHSRHELSPFLLDYNVLSNTTPKFDSIMNANPAIYVSMRNQFVPKIKYTYTYTSQASSRNPIFWETSVTEAGNLLSLAYMAAGKKFNEKEKHLFNNPFAQFVKINTNFRKTWALGNKSQLVGHVAAGLLWAFGNSTRAPYSEQFYVGGANSIRAFTIRSIGPGNYVAPSSNYSYLDQTGDIKFEANLEYRFNLFGSLYGAVFLDAGNIWLLKKDESRPDAMLKPAKFFNQLATGTGAGLRYDMEFLVIRLDLGIGIHVPYDTGRSGYYNIPHFNDALGLHFAIGYPF